MVRTAGSRSQSNQPFSCQKRNVLFAEAAFRNLRRLSRACSDPVSGADRAQSRSTVKRKAVIKKDEVFGTHTRSWCAMPGLARCASIEFAASLLNLVKVFYIAGSGFSRRSRKASGKRRQTVVPRPGLDVIVSVPA
jgi:hypothetical protein